jgi:hypothetical protein
MAKIVQHRGNGDLFYAKIAQCGSGMMRKYPMKIFDQRLNIHRPKFCQHDGLNDESKIIQDGRSGDSSCAGIAQDESGNMRKCRHDNKNWNSSCVTGYAKMRR